MSDDEKAIRDVIATWLRATAAGDMTTVMSLMADDVVFLTPGQPPFGKKEFAAVPLDTTQVRFEGKSDVREVRVAGGLGYVLQHLTITISPIAGGSPMRMAGHTLSVFRREPDGRWVLARDANFVAPVPAEEGKS
jgi:uncharacterized protein (TIGR02246 family)